MSAKPKESPRKNISRESAQNSLEKQIAETGIFEPGTMRVNQSFLDLLNGESEKMTAHLQNPDNWPGVMRAARELKGKLPELEREIGIHAEIGPIEEATHTEVERLLGGGAPRTIEPENIVVHDFRQRTAERVVHEAVDAFRASKGLTPRDWNGGDASLGDAEALDAILADANDAPQAKKEGMMRWLGRGLLKRLGFLALLAGAPIPQMQLQHCQISRQGSLAQITCDSRDVCPPGFVLETTWDGDWPDRGDQLMKVMGYGPDAENTCARPEGYGRKVNQLIP